MIRRLTRTTGALAIAAILAAGGTAHGGENPAAPGFDAAGSDPQAIEIADRVMEHMGGRDAWDATRHVAWSFFGHRPHVWDRHTGDIRVEGTDRDGGESYVILMNLHSGEGRAWSGGNEVTGEELAAFLDRGEALWINDSYWMFMPYKLKDSGVTLRYAGPGTTAAGAAADVLELTFSDVGRTPQNRYRVYVGRDSGLVEQWDFFREASNEEPDFSTPWANWQRYGKILLSDDRGESRHSGIAVFDALPASVYTSPEPVDWKEIAKGR